MRIMIDTNVMISGLLFPHSQINAVVLNIMSRHKLVIASYVLAEFKDVVRRKFPRFIGQVDEMLAKMSYELVYTPDEMERGSFSIRDAADYPVLYTAIVEGVDILVTGDKDFADVQIVTPEIMTPRQFMETYMS